MSNLDRNWTSTSKSRLSPFVSLSKKQHLFQTLSLILIPLWVIKVDCLKWTVLYIKETINKSTDVTFKKVPNALSRISINSYFVVNLLGPPILNSLLKSFNVKKNNSQNEDNTNPLEITFGLRFHFLVAYVSFRKREGKIWFSK